MKLAALNVKTGVAASAALLAGLTAVSACSSKSDENKSAAGEITVTASDDACKLSATSAKAIRLSFRAARR